MTSILEGDYVSIHDLRNQTQLNAGLSLGTTLFVCFVLASAAIIFTHTTNSLVINPIEEMVVKVKRISENPLLAAQEEENEALIHEQEEERERKLNGGKRKKKIKGEVMETKLLEQTIVKIGSLLALGFGEAGSKIIAENMKGSGDVDPMLPGQKIMAIFGFCDIRNFTDATEVL